MRGKDINSNLTQVIYSVVLILGIGLIVHGQSKVESQASVLNNNNKTDCDIKSAKKLTDEADDLRNKAPKKNIISKQNDDLSVSEDFETENSESVKQNLILSLQKLIKAKEIFQKCGNRLEEAKVFEAIGTTNMILFRDDDAIDAFLNALIIIRELSKKNEEASLLQTIAMAHRIFGRKQKALEYYRLALIKLRELKDLRGELNLSNLVGRTFYTMGDYGNALDSYNHALSLAQELRLTSFTTSFGLARTNFSLGNYQTV